MDGIAIELTNSCNRFCLHCIRNKADLFEFLPLSLAQEVLSQAKDLGFRTVSLTGGEVALYPHLKDFIALVVDQDFTFSLMTNGHRFRERLLPLLLIPKNQEKLKGVCFSLDGAKAESHDALRGEGSFREVIEAASLCKLKNIPLSLKSVITNFNKEEITDLALLGASFGAKNHCFLHPLPTPRMIVEGALPSPRELSGIVYWITNSLSEAITTNIVVEGYGPGTTLFSCLNILHNISFDYQGNMVLCCNLSHVTQGVGKPSTFGGEWLADLKEVPLQKGIIRHFHGHAKLMEARLRHMEVLGDLTLIPCYWCLRHFGKLEWLRDFSDSPWAAGVLEKGGSHAAV